MKVSTAYGWISWVDGCNKFSASYCIKDFLGWTTIPSQCFYTMPLGMVLISSCFSSLSRFFSFPIINMYLPSIDLFVLNCSTCDTEKQVGFLLVSCSRSFRHVDYWISYSHKYVFNWLHFQAIFQSQQNCFWFDMLKEIIVACRNFDWSGSSIFFWGMDELCW